MAEGPGGGREGAGGEPPSRVVLGRLRALSPAYRRRYWDAMSLLWTQVGDLPEFREPREQAISWLTAVPGVPRPRILDLGCGPGEYASAAAEAGLSVVAVDLSPRMLRAARARAAAHRNVHFVRADLDAPLPHPDAVFDAAVCACVLQWVGDPGRLVAEIHRVLRPGGRLILIIVEAGRRGRPPRGGGWPRLLLTVRSWPHRWSRVEKRPLVDLLRQVETAGFVLAEQRRFLTTVGVLLHRLPDGRRAGGSGP